MKAALARSNHLLANDALRLLSRLMRKKGLIMEPAVFVNIARNLVESALLMHCPSMDQIQARTACFDRRILVHPGHVLVFPHACLSTLLRLPLVQAEAISAGSFWAHAVSDAARPEFLRRNERLMAQLVKRDLPHWLESDWAGHADAFRLRLALDCWDRCGARDDVEGT